MTDFVAGGADVRVSFPSRNGSTVNITLDHSRDDLLTAFGKATLKDRYLLKGETPQVMFGRVAAWFSKSEDHAQRTYDAMSQLWFMPATPVLSNGGTDRGLPISCFLNAVPDSMVGIKDTWAENVDLASNGGGIGTYWGGVREKGAGIRGRGQTSGIIPFIKVMDSLTLAVSQGSLRRGSAAVYLDIHHPEIEEFVEIRRPTGDQNRRSLNIHHGVMIDDAFMEAVEANTSYDLRSPASGLPVKTIKARELFIRLITARLETGEPYMVFSDTVNRKRPALYKALGLTVKQSNLCVAPETMILTDKGNVEIQTVAGQFVNVWNGEEFSEARVEKTGDGQKLLTVTLSDGASIDCTPYHKFYVVEDYWKEAKEVRAQDLKPGMKLMKGALPLIEFNVDWTDAYYHGFYCGDGSHDRQGNALLYFYGGKKVLAEGLEEVFGNTVRVRQNSGGDRHIAVVEKGTLRPKFQVPHDTSVSTRVKWLAGLCDSDGTLTRNGETQSIQIANTNLDFLNEIRMMLQTLGIASKVRPMAEAGVRSMPDGHGGLAPYECKTTYRLMFDEAGVQRLLTLGFKPRRLAPLLRTPKREAAQFVQVEGVQDNGRIDDTYCFNEPSRHMGVFNGVLTGNCSEIALHTGIDYVGKDRTAVCCLSSLNMETMDQWFENRQFMKDVLYFLDEVLQDFIDRTKGKSGFEKARYSAIMERSIGLGVMGFHSYLQSWKVAFDSPEADEISRDFFDWFKVTGDEINVEAAKELGTCIDSLNAPERFKGDKLPGVRWAHWSSIAPTASISIIAGNASPCTEPWPGNTFTQKTLSGSFEVRNRYLNNLLADRAATAFALEGESFRSEWLEDQWASITAQMGSVQHLPYLTEHEKAVFATAFELDQKAVIRQAAERALNICQMASVNISLPGNVSKAELVKLHLSAWKQGVPSLYYCRSRSVARAMNVAGEMPQPREPHVVTLKDNGPATEAVIGEDCESCQ